MDKMEYSGGNGKRRTPHVITKEDILAATKEPGEGSVRCCGECEEGHCCDDREGKPRFVGIDYSRD